VTATSSMVAASTTSRPARRVPAWILRLGLVLAFIAVWQVCVATELLNPLSVSAPLDCFRHLPEVLSTGQFWSDLGRTSQTTVTAFVAAVITGLTAGAILNRYPTLRNIIEPYLVGSYAVPVIVFYPTFLVVFGIGTIPIIITAFLMAVVPVIVGTVVGLGELRPTHRKLAHSLGCSPLQGLTKILLPSALPLLLPGVKLAFVYALAATVGVEFIVADRGLGFRIGESYRNFDGVDMYTYIVIMVIIAAAVNSAFNALERLLRKDLA